MNVLQLLTTTDPQIVVDAHNTAFPRNVITRDTYDEFLSIIRSKILVRNDNKVEISHWRVEHDDPVDDEDRFDVLLIKDGETYSMSFADWGEILACDVLCEIPTYFPRELQAAYIFWEMTWHGFEEETIARRDELEDRIDDLNRATEARSTSDDKDAHSSAIRRTNLFDALFPDDTAEERAEREADAQRHIANFHTRRVFKNGVQQ